MRALLLTIVSSIALGIASPAFGEVTPQDRTGFAAGLATGLGNEIVFDLDGVQFNLPVDWVVSVPLRVLPYLLIEPEFGIMHMSMSQAEEGDETTSEDAYTGVRVGVGGMFVLQRDDTDFYAGIRLGISNVSTSSTESNGEDSTEATSSQTNFYIGPAVGAMYYFSKHFSLGGEVGLPFTFYGNTEKGVESGGVTLKQENENDSWNMATRCSITARWFF